MTPEQFVVWLRGFAQAANNFTLTPKQWDDVKEKLASVNIGAKATHYSYNLEGESTNTNNTARTLLND